MYHRKEYLEAIYNSKYYIYIDPLVVGLGICESLVAMNMTCT